MHNALIYSIDNLQAIAKRCSQAVKFNVRNLMGGLIIIIVLAFVILRGDQLTELAETMSQGATIPLVVAILIQLCKYISQSFGYSFSFQAVGESMRQKDTLKLVFGTFFLNTVVPSLNLAGTTLVINESRRHGIEAGKATSAALLMQITIDSAFTFIMFLSFTILALTVGLAPGWFLLGLILVAIVGAMVGLMALGRKNPDLVKKILYPIASLINKILVKFKKDPMAPWVDKTVASFSQAAELIVSNPKPAAKAWGCSLFASCCELSAFCLVGIAFGVTVPESLVCGYVVATLFAMVSITPQGVGVVEAAVTVAFTAFGASAAAGMAIGLVYRGIVFWMPFIIGAVLLQFTKSLRGDEKDEKPQRKNLNEARKDEARIQQAQERAAARNALRPKVQSTSAEPSKTSEPEVETEVE